MSLDNLTPQEADELNRQTEAELQQDVEQFENERKAVVSSALQHLLDVTEHELIEIPFSSSAGEAILKVKANPPQKTMKDLMRISQAAEKGEETTDEEENRLCRILEDLTIEPKIPFEVWKSGQVPDVIAARIIVELMKHTARQQDEMVEEVESFRKDGRRTKASRNRRDPAKATK
jgi:hypothetical protein